MKGVLDIFWDMSSFLLFSDLFISIWIRADDAYILGEIYTLQDLKLSDSFLRKDFFP